MQQWAGGKCTSESDARGAEEVAVGVEGHSGRFKAAREPDYEDRSIIVDDWDAETILRTPVMEGELKNRFAASRQKRLADVKPQRHPETPKL